MFSICVEGEVIELRQYRPILTVNENRKGVLDIDTVKGCTLGMRAYPQGGCYGECYAQKIARLYGFDFGVSVDRQFCGREHRDTLIRRMILMPAKWYRIGTAGDPSHNWKHTIAIIRALRWAMKIPVVITKHWLALTDKQVEDLRWLKVTTNTSASGMDTDIEIEHRTAQLLRLREAGVHSVLRVVTCKYGSSDWARRCAEKQEYLLSLPPTIDNPLRVPRHNPHVLNGDILVESRPESVGGGKTISLHSERIHIGTCGQCPDQCGVDRTVRIESHQMEMFV